MNGEPLLPVHGAPLRVVVPGYIGARSVKWLERIEVRSGPWAGYFQHVVYRLLPEDGTPGPGAGSPLGLVALNADVLAPADGATVVAGLVEVRGYAFAGGERHVARVDVSIDAGATWSQAELLDDLGPWAWRHWRTEVDLAPRRARDPRPRLGLLGGHAARGRGGALEPQGLREQRDSRGSASPLGSHRPVRGQGLACLRVAVSARAASRTTRADGCAPVSVRTRFACAPGSTS